MLKNKGNIKNTQINYPLKLIITIDMRFRFKPNKIETRYAYFVKGKRG